MSYRAIRKRSSEMTVSGRYSVMSPISFSTIAGVRDVYSCQMSGIQVPHKHSTPPGSS